MQFYYSPSDSVLFGDSTQLRKSEETFQTNLDWHYHIPHPDGYNQVYFLSNGLAERHSAHLPLLKSRSGYVTAGIQDEDKKISYQLSGYLSSQNNTKHLSSLALTAHKTGLRLKSLNLETLASVSDNQFHQESDKLKSGQSFNLQGQIAQEKDALFSFSPALLSAVTVVDAQAKWQDYKAFMLGMKIGFNTAATEFNFTTTLQHKKFAAPALHPSLLTPVYSALSARRDIEHKAEFNIRHIVRAFPGWHINLKLSSSKTSSNIANFSYYQTEASLSTSYYF